MQYLTIATKVGPKTLPAPEGWVFDDTAKIVWSQLLGEAAKTEWKTKRDEFVSGGKVYVLCLVLSNALGMAPPYWQHEADEAVKLLRAG